jgi:hypothetical protein
MRYLTGDFLRIQLPWSKRRRVLVRLRIPVDLGSVHDIRFPVSKPVVQTINLKQKIRHLDLLKARCCGPHRHHIRIDEHVRRKLLLVLMHELIHVHNSAVGIAALRR